MRKGTTPCLHLSAGMPPAARHPTAARLPKASHAARHRSARALGARPHRLGCVATTTETHETDVVVIGGGLGGLCAGALLAKYGLRVTVCESHSIPGGAAHSWHRDGYTFESGPSLYSGMTARPSLNPIGQVRTHLSG
jgi:NADPH-dependent 2,4-dienoyl-CoA reductase/sulfur reductase-like enzyme